MQFELDDGASVSPPDPSHYRGGPLDCSRSELEEAIRDLLFSEPRYLPGEPRAEPALVSLLSPHGIETTLDALAALPLSVIVSDEVEAERAAQAGR